MSHRYDTRKDAAAAAQMARRLRTMYTPRENAVVRMAVDHYLRRMRQLRNAKLLPRLYELEP